MSSMDGLSPRAKSGNVLTEILFDDGGILVIDHSIGRQVSETQVVGWG